MYICIWISTVYEQTCASYFESRCPANTPHAIILLVHVHTPTFCIHVHRHIQSQHHVTPYSSNYPVCKNTVDLYSWLRFPDPYKASYTDYYQEVPKISAMWGGTHTEMPHTCVHTCMTSITIIFGMCTRTCMQVKDWQNAASEAKLLVLVLKGRATTDKHSRLICWHFQLRPYVTVQLISWVQKMAHF